MKNEELTGIIWLYWETPKNSIEPEIATRCKKIFKNYKNTIILDEITIHDYLSDLVDCSRIQHIAQKTDYYRAKLLYEYGGIWLDMDSILLEDITYLYYDLIKTEFDMCGNYDLINEEIIFNIQNLVFKPKSIIAKKWCEYCEEFILSNSYIHWASLGGIALGKVIKENNYIDKVKSIPEIKFSLGYENKKYEQYYSIDDIFIDNNINFIIENDIKYIMLFGTFMYKIDIPENCLIDKMFKLKKIDLDFIEIGTSNFNTVIQTCDEYSIGISIEPVKYYLDQLPNKKNVTKINAAITGDNTIDDFIKIFYIPEDIIIKEKLDFFFKGCNKIGTYHPLHIKYNLTNYVKIDDVKLINIGDFLNNNNIRRIKYLQIDTEGHDINIMNGLYNYISKLSKEYHPDEIKFETNQYSTKYEIDNIINLYNNLNYIVSYRNDDGDTIIKKIINV